MAAPLSSPEQSPKPHTVPPSLRLLKNGRRVTPLDPNAVIAAAFTAAGLLVPEVPTALLGATRCVTLGPIIAAALKAAGLRKI
jgi:hypothetical protein